MRLTPVLPSYHVACLSFREMGQQVDLVVPRGMSVEP